MRLFIGLVTVIIALTPVVTCAQEIGIVTGSPNTTYSAIAENLKDLAREKAGIQLTISSSPGSLQNVTDVRNRQGVQLGLVQADVLAFMDAPSNASVLKETRDKIRM